DHVGAARIAVLAGVPGRARQGGRALAGCVGLRGCLAAPHFPACVRGDPHGAVERGWWNVSEANTPYRPMLVQELRERLQIRQAVLAAGILLTTAFYLFGNLDWRFGIAGLLALAGWAVLWPIGDYGSHADAKPAVVHGHASATARTDYPIWQAMLAGLPDS